MATISYIEKPVVAQLRHLLSEVEKGNIDPPISAVMLIENEHETELAIIGNPETVHAVGQLEILKTQLILNAFGISERK